MEASNSGQQPVSEAAMLLVWQSWVVLGAHRPGLNIPHTKATNLEEEEARVATVAVAWVHPQGLLMRFAKLLLKRRAHPLRSPWLCLTKVRLPFEGVGAAWIEVEAEGGLEAVDPPQTAAGAEVEVEAEVACWWAMWDTLPVRPATLHREMRNQGSIQPYSCPTFLVVSSKSWSRC